MKPRPEIYDLYWQFAAERQKIFFKKLRGEKPPYTNDPILATYKFCNVYRASDRVSQYLVRNVIYTKNKHSERDTLFRIFLFRLLNKIETWQKLEEKFDGVSLKTFSPTRYSAALSQIRASGQPIYGNAFILCANKAFGFDQKHDNHLALLEKVFVREKLDRKFVAAKSLESLFNQHKNLPLIGNFMAYQLAIDFNYSEVFDFDENDFTVAGPGALRGIKKCFLATGNKNHAQVIQYMVENQDRQFKKLGLKFQNLFGRPLHAIDCQGLFCEVDKYTRVKFPGLKSNRIKIKTKYRPNDSKISYFYPPKWGLEYSSKSSKLPFLS